MLIEMIRHGIEIISGYLILVFDKITNRFNKKAYERMKICKECPHYKKGICEICGCYLAAKTRVDFDIDDEGKSIDGCPERKW